MELPYPELESPVNLPCDPLFSELGMDPARTQIAVNGTTDRRTVADRVL